MFFRRLEIVLFPRENDGILKFANCQRAGFVK
jgi:hypothetical protein